MTVSDITDMARDAPAPWVLATQLPAACNINPPAEVWPHRFDAVVDDDSEDWLVVLNGSGEPWVKGAHAGRESEPVTFVVPQGCAFVAIDGKARAILRPDAGEYYPPDGDVEALVERIVEELHARLVTLGMELPDVDSLLEERGDD